MIDILIDLRFCRYMIYIICLLFSTNINSQGFNFNSNIESNSGSIINPNWYKYEINEIYDSLNLIDLATKDFEFRLWSSGSGMFDSHKSVFILRHYKNGNWRSLYYEKHYDYVEDSMELEKLITKNDFFNNLKLLDFNSDQNDTIWKSLQKMNILNCSQPDFNGITYLSFDCSSKNIIELIKPNIIRSCNFDDCLATDKRALKSKEYKELYMIFKYINEIIKKTATNTL